MTVVSPGFLVTQAFPESVAAAMPYPAGAPDEAGGESGGCGFGFGGLAGGGLPSGLGALRINWYVLLPLVNVRLSPATLMLKG